MSSTTKSPKKYIKGSAKQVVFNEGSGNESRIINVDMLLEDLLSLSVTEGGYVKITIAERREKDQYGNTHSVYENSFKAEKGKSSTKADLKPMPAAAPQEQSGDDFPF